MKAAVLLVTANGQRVNSFIMPVVLFLHIFILLKIRHQKNISTYFSPWGEDLLGFFFFA